MTRASLEKDPRDVAAMFDDVAGKYDLTNDVLSLGQDRLWRRAVVRPWRPCRGSGPGHRRGHGDLERAVRRRRGRGRAGRLLARDAGRGQPPPSGPRRSRPPTRCACPSPTSRSTPSRCRSGCATSPTPVPRCASSSGSPGRAAAWWSASSATRSTRAVPQGLHRVPHALAAADRAPGQLQPRVLRLPRRVDPGLARHSASSLGRSSARGWSEVAWRNLTGGDRGPAPGRTTARLGRCRGRCRRG